MARKKLNINFNIRAYEPRRDGACPIEARIYAYGRDLKFQTGVYCLPKEWDTKRQRVKPAADDARESNDELAKFELAAGQAHKQHVEKGTPFNRETITALVRQTDENGSEDFFAFAKARINEKTKLGAGTVRQLNAELSKLEKFRASLRFSDMDTKFILDYQKYMENKLGNNPNTVQKTMRKLSYHLNAAVDLGMITKNPVAALSFRGCDPEEIECLEPEELEAVENCRIANASLERARKLFLLQCYTGAAHIDLGQLRPEHIITVNRKEYISKDRGKTDVNALPPLFPKAKKILEELAFYERGKLHVWTVQTYNKFIREVMALAGIKTEISSHTARKTCGMILLNDEENPVSLEVVSRILGHKKISTTQRWYAKVKARRIAAETANFKRFG